MDAVLRGKKYSVSNVSTVKELQMSVKEQAGLDVAKQGVLFGGRKLKPTDILEDVGVEDGSVINIVPSSGNKKSKSSAGTTSSVVNVNNGESNAKKEGGNSMEEMLKKAGVDASQIDELMKSMPGGENGQMPNLQESMGMMQDMMNSPLFKEYMNDPERLEQSRQMILNNPMMKSMMAGMPGFDEILNDPVKWRETMIAAADMYKNMGSDMMNSMAGMGGGPGAFGLGGNDPGAFGMGGGSSSNALDELSEGEE